MCRCCKANMHAQAAPLTLPHITKISYSSLLASNSVMLSSDDMPSLGLYNKERRLAFLNNAQQRAQLETGRCLGCLGISKLKGSR